MKYYTGKTAAEMTARITEKWTTYTDYEEGRRGCNGEMGRRDDYVRIDDKVYVLTYDRDGWPVLKTEED